MAEPRPSFDSSSSNSIPLRKRIKGIESIKSNEIIDRLMAEWKIPFKNKGRIMRVINSFLQEVQKEVWEWKKVKVRKFWFFYPAKLADKRHYCGITGKTLPKRKGSTMLRFMQTTSMRQYFKDNFKWIKWKETKK